MASTYAAYGSLIAWQCTAPAATTGPQAQSLQEYPLISSIWLIAIAQYLSSKQYSLQLLYIGIHNNTILKLKNNVH